MQCFHFSPNFSRMVFFIPNFILNPAPWGLTLQNAPRAELPLDGPGVMGPIPARPIANGMEKRHIKVLPKKKPRALSEDFDPSRKRSCYPGCACFDNHWLRIEFTRIQTRGQ